MALRTALVLVAALAGTGVCAFLVARFLLENGKVALGHVVEAPGAVLGRLKNLPGGAAAWRVYEQVASRRRSEKMRACMPESVRLISTALASGSSLLQALRYAAQHSSEPMSSELMQTVWDIEAGQSFSEAMTKLRKRSGGTEFSYLAACMELQHVSGGSLGNAIESVSASLQQTAQLAEELRTKTTQGKLSARIVAIMPICLLAVLSVFSPGYLGQFFSSPVGVLLFVLALALEAAGILFIRKTLAIDLSSGLGKGA